MRIVLVRHGESLGNVDPLAYGRVGDPHIPLTEEGQHQVLATGDFLASYYQAHPMEGRSHPQAVDTSTWMRAVQTEEAATRHLPAGLIRFERHDSLKEQSFGILYREHTRCGTRLKNILRRAAEEYRNNPFEAVPPQGESPAMHYQRVQVFIQKLRDDAQLNGITDRLIVAHGATNRHIITSLLGWPPNAWKHIENQGNGDVTLLQIGDQGASLRKIYDGVKRQTVDHNPVLPLPLPVYAGPIIK